MNNVLHIENSFWRVEFTPGSGRLTLTDRKNNTTRSSDAPFGFEYGNFYSYNLFEHCDLSTESAPSKLTFRFDAFVWWARFARHPYRKPDPGPEPKFEFAVELAGDEVLFHTAAIEGMDEEPCKLTFPAGLITWKCDEAGEVVVPSGYGTLFEFPRTDSFEIRHTCSDCHCCVPIYGIMSGNRGGLGVFLRDDSDQHSVFGVSTRKNGEAFYETSWLFNRRMANYPRVMSWKAFAPGENYAALAKYYRKIRQDEGRFVTLREKIAASPEVEKLVGAVIWKHNVYSQPQLPPGVRHDYSLYMPTPEDNRVEQLPGNWTARELFDRAHANGFDRLCVYNTGWNRFGFDSGYPTRLPPNPERGTAEEFRAAAEYARSLSPDYIYSVHDNCLDSYANSPEEHEDDLARDENGVIRQGGIWRAGRARLFCTSQSLKYARRDIPELVKIIGRGSIYTDVLGSIRLYECHHPDHPQSFRDDIASRRNVMRYLKEQFGSLATEGAPSDFCADIVDLGAFCSFITLHPLAASVSPRPVAIPFWQLIYHDSVLNYTSEGTFGLSGDDYQAIVALYGLLPTQLDPVSLKISRELRDAYLSEMVSHEFLAPPAGSFRWVARTRFSDGTEVTANLTDEPWEQDGERIAPHGFLIRKRG